MVDVLNAFYAYSNQRLSHWPSSHHTHSDANHALKVTADRLIKSNIFSSVVMTSSSERTVNVLLG